MKCAMCDGIVVSKKGDIEFKSRVLGKIEVPNISFLECKECGDKRYNEKMANKIHNYIISQEESAIKSLPIGEFISLNDAAKQFGITKQAFSKSPKIKNGFIYSVKVGGRKFYHMKSILDFQLKGDGRFLLSEYTPTGPDCRTCEAAKKEGSTLQRRRRDEVFQWKENGEVDTTGIDIKTIQADDYTSTKRKFRA